MTVNPDKADAKCKYSHMTCRDCVQLPVYAYGMDDSIENQMFNTPPGILVHLAALDNVRKPKIGTLNKEWGDVFSDFWTDFFMEILLRYVSEVVFKWDKGSPQWYIFGSNNPQSYEKWGIYIMTNVL